MFDFAKRSATILILTGILATIIGVVALAWPTKTALTLVLIWGWYALIDGGLELVAAARAENKGTRNFLLLTGIIGVVTGLLVIFRPLESSVVLAWILGIWLILRGVSSLFSAFSREVGTPRWLLVLSALLFIIAGIIFIANPGTAALAVSTILGILAIVWGIFTFGSGLAIRAQVKTVKAAGTAGA